MSDKLQWWGYRHISGSYQVKRYFDKRDIEEAIESPFVEEIAGPYYATDSKNALEKLKLILDESF